MAVARFHAAVPTAVAHFQVVVPMVAELSHVADLMAGEVPPSTSDASTATWK